MQTHTTRSFSTASTTFAQFSSRSDCTAPGALELPRVCHGELLVALDANRRRGRQCLATLRAVAAEPVMCATARAVARRLQPPARSW
eukprot:5932080-Alexandrium_andersonii.AAC.1